MTLRRAAWVGGEGGSLTGGAVKETRGNGDRVKTAGSKCFAGNMGTDWGSVCGGRRNQEAVCYFKGEDTKVC